MREQRFALKCYHADCADVAPLEILVRLPDNRMSSGRVKEKSVYCERNHLNIVTLPDAWDVRPLVLGDDVVGRQGNIPILQGRSL